MIDTTGDPLSLPPDPQAATAEFALGDPVAGGMRWFLRTVWTVVRRSDWVAAELERPGSERAAVSFRRWVVAITTTALGVATVSICRYWQLYQPLPFHFGLTEWLLAGFAVVAVLCFLLMFTGIPALWCWRPDWSAVRSARAAAVSGYTSVWCLWFLPVVVLLGVAPWVLDTHFLSDDVSQMIVPAMLFLGIAVSVLFLVTSWFSTARLLAVLAPSTRRRRRAASLLLLLPACWAAALASALLIPATAFWVEIVLA